MSQGQFKADQVWDALLDLLIEQLDQVDVASISQRDFSQEGEIILTPPSVRVLFDGESAHSTSDSQRLSYEVVGRFLVMVADQDLRSAVHQARASAKLAAQAKNLLAGARIVLADGDVSEPVTWVSTQMLPVPDLGIAYALAFEVPGLAQFDGLNAQPAQGGN